MIILLVNPKEKEKEKKRKGTQQTQSSSYTTFPPFSPSLLYIPHSIRFPCFVNKKKLSSSHAHQQQQQQETKPKTTTKKSKIWNTIRQCPLKTIR